MCIDQFSFTLRGTPIFNTMASPAPLFKGPGYRNYKRNLARIEYIFSDEFPNWQASSARRIHDATGIPESTIYFWRARWNENNSWRPDCKERGACHRIFTNEEEQAISEFIYTNFLLVNRAFTNQNFRDLVTQAFEEKHQGEKIKPKFSISEGFIQDFKLRNMFSTRRVHTKRRPRRDEVKEADFLARMKKVLDEVDRDRILNVDETFWTSVPTDLVTWGRTGEQDVSVHLDGDEKEGITVVACVTASGCKLPLWLIAKGKSDRCHGQLGDPQGHLVTHSESGWSTAETFSLFLMSIRERFRDDGPIYLLLDQYSVHRTETVRNLAQSLGIELIFIPPGMTDAYQPLDRRVFGVLKQYLRLLWRKEYFANPSQKFTKQKAVELLIPAWERISPYLVRSGWAIYDDDDDQDTDDE